MKTDDNLDDDELAYGVTGLFGASGPSPGKVTSGFNISGFQASPALSASGAGSTSKQGAAIQKFELPALVKTGKEIVGEIKMPALPLKANLKKKNLEEDAVVKEAMAYLSTEVKTPVRDGVPFPTGDENKITKPGLPVKKLTKSKTLRRPR